jgi:hypothetical protein
MLVLTQLISEDIDWHWKLLWCPWFHQVEPCYLSSWVDVNNVILRECCFCYAFIGKQIHWPLTMIHVIAHSIVSTEGHSDFLLGALL